MLPPSYRNAEPREPVLRFPWAPTLAYLVLRAEVPGTHLLYSIIRTETPSLGSAMLLSSREAKEAGCGHERADGSPRRAIRHRAVSRLVKVGRGSVEHTPGCLSLSLPRSRNGTPSRGSATFLNNACVHIILFKSHLERESSILQPCAPEFCWKTLQNISPSGRGQVRLGGRPHRAGVRRAAKRQRESLRSLTGRREEDPRPTDRISAATRASYFGERSSLPALPRVRSRGEPKGHLWGSVFFLERGLDGEQPR